MWQVTEFLSFFRLTSTPLHVYTMLCFSTYCLMDTWLTSTSCSWEWLQKYLSASLLSIILVELLGHRIIMCLIFLGNCHPASLSHQECTYIKVQFLTFLPTCLLLLLGDWLVVT